MQIEDGDQREKREDLCKKVYFGVIECHPTILLLRSMVPSAGLEPAHPCGQRILSPVRLPFRHEGFPRGIISTEGWEFNVLGRGLKS